MKCWNCGKDVSQTGGKRHKLYCNDACRKAYKRSHNRTPLPDKSLPDTAEQPIADKPEQQYQVQHHSPMMVGYVPLPKVEP